MNAALGLNARNAHIARRNPRRAIIDAKDKSLTKRRLSAIGIPVPPTIAEIETRRQAGRLAVGDLPDRFVVKPSRGSMGRGVMVVVGRDGANWITGGGIVTQRTIRDHVAQIVDGEFSEHDHDAALIEPLLEGDRALADLAPAGLPDIRVIVDGDRPLMAMLRMPTIDSGGRGNLHQGGVGAAIDLATGRLEHAVRNGEPIQAHPDTLAPFASVSIPFWPRVLDIAARCGDATRLGYLGVDVVIDRTMGPLVLEVNSHPGLEIQNVCRRPLRVA